jgi:hypothetical protein
MYWCDVCGLEIPAANVFDRAGSLVHRKGEDSGDAPREGDLHPVRHVADSHEVTPPPGEAFTDG